MKLGQSLIAFLFVGLASAQAGPISDFSQSAASSCQRFYSRFVAAPKDHLRSRLQDYSPEQRGLLAAQYLYHFARGRVPTIPENSADPFFRKSAGFVGRQGKRLLRFLSPVPPWPLPRQAGNATEAIFAKLWHQPKFEPSAEEVELLKRSGAYHYFLGRKKFLLANSRHVKPIQTSGAYSLAFTKAGLLSLSAAAALEQAYELHSNRVDYEDFIKRPAEDKNGKPVVQLLVETPQPHAAIRIGHKVYSYGYDYMTAKPVAEYLGGDGADSLPDAVKSAGARAVRVVNLNLSAAEIASLQRDLEENTGKAYDNRTLVNDCATMVKRALAKNTSVQIPWAIDPSPTLAATYLSLLRATGDARIGKTELVLGDKSVNPYALAARNAYAAIMEGKVLLGFLPYNAAERAYVDLTKRDGDLQYYLPEVRARIDEWKTETRAQVTGELKSLVDFQAIADTKNSAERARKTEAAVRLIQSVQERISEDIRETLDYPGSDLKDVVIATEKQEALAKISGELLARLRK